jgi:hypothetical protein
MALAKHARDIRASVQRVQKQAPRLQASSEARTGQAGGHRFILFYFILFLGVGPSTQISLE